MTSATYHPAACNDAADWFLFDILYPWLQTEAVAETVPDNAEETSIKGDVYA